MDCTTMLVVAGLEHVAQTVCAIFGLAVFVGGLCACIAAPKPEVARMVAAVLVAFFVVFLVAGVTAAALPNLYELQQLYGKGCTP